MATTTDTTVRPQNGTALMRFVLIFGIVYALIGILGFIPGLVTAPAPADGLARGAMEMQHGRLLGLFPVNFLHNLFHLAVGIWGIFAAKAYNTALNYCRILAVVFLLLMIFGLLPGLNVMFGLLPLYGHDIWLHLLTAGLLGYFGYVLPKRGVMHKPNL